MSTREDATAAGYDRVARAYADRFYHELEHKPLDRALLDCLAAELRGTGKYVVADVGCGPGQIARALHERGVDTIGVDVSPEMIAVARRLAPHIPFACGSMLALDAADGTWAGIVAFYAIIHLEAAELATAFREFRRVLAPGGLVFLSFHVGEDRVHVDEFLGERVDLDFTFCKRSRGDSEIVANQLGRG